MDSVAYVCKDIVYNVTPITDCDFIDADMVEVAHLIEGTDSADYRASMEDSVSQGLAYSVYEGKVRKGFVYNRVHNNKYYGASICINGTIPLVIGLKSIFEITDFNSISFAPHKDNLRYFKSMVAGHNIRAYYSGVPTVTITANKLTAEGRRLFFYLGIEEIT